jgi:hypothetical protein
LLPRIASDDGKRFVVRADEELTAFLELESAIRAAELERDCGGGEIKVDKLSRTAQKQPKGRIFGAVPRT